MVIDNSIAAGSDTDNLLFSMYWLVRFVVQLVCSKGAAGFAVVESNNPNKYYSS